MNAMMNKSTPKWKRAKHKRWNVNQLFRISSISSEMYIKVKVIYFSFQLHTYTSEKITKIVRVFKRNGTWHEFRKILRAKMNNIFLFIMIIANVAHWKKPIRKAVSKNCHFFQCTEQLRIQNHPYNCVLNKKKLSARVPRHRHSQKWKWK